MIKILQHQEEGQFQGDAPSIMLTDNDQTLIRAGRAEEALDNARSSLSDARLDADDAGKPGMELVSALQRLGAVERELGHAEDSEAALREALETASEIAAPTVVLAGLRTELGTLLDFSMRETDAVPLYEQAIADYESMEPPMLEISAQLRNNLAMIYKGLGKFALAEQHYLRALEILEASEGQQSESVASIYNNLGGLYFSAGFVDQAKDMFLTGLSSRMELLGRHHPDVAQSYCNLATVYHELGDNPAAVQYFERGLDIMEEHIENEAGNYETVGMDYIALLEMTGDQRKAAAFKKRMQRMLA